MPELPEVETIRKQLIPVLTGKIISGVDIRLKKQIKNQDFNQFKQLARYSKVITVSRRAKMLIIKTTKYWIVFHLKMTGQLIFKDKGGNLKGGGHPIKNALGHLPNKYSHVIFKFKDGSQLFFNDVRQFGWVTLVAPGEKYVEELSAINLGPEPLTQDFVLKNFIECLSKRKNLNIYKSLLDQKCVVGVGNIYANESLFSAGINPTRLNKDINKQEYKKLYQAIKKILAKAVKERGTSISDYMDALGDYGQFAKYLKVYQKQNKPCARQGCKGKVVRIKIGGRSAFYCDTCQL